MTRPDERRSIGNVAPRTIALLLAVGLLAGCSSGAANKAGGSSAPVVLRLANSNSGDQPGTDTIQRFASQVQKRSGGAIRVQITYLAAGSSTPYVETRTISAVRTGRFDLGWIGARAWDLNGLKSFRALQAPFLVTSTRLLNRVVTSPMAQEMIDSLSTEDVVGLALAPDYLRHPVGMGRGLVTPADFAGARIRIQPSRVTAASIRALGSRPVEISNDDIGLAIHDKRVDAQELSMVNTPGGSVATENVVFFGKAFTLFANRDAYRRLTDDQRRAVREAAADAVRYAVAHHVPDSEIAKGYCFDRRRIVLAKPADLAVLIGKEQSVYRWLEADPQTKRFIEQIRAWKRTTPDPTTTAASIPAACRRAQQPAQARGAARLASLVDGTYRWVITKADARAYWHQPPQPGGDTFPIIGTAILRNGSWRFASPERDEGTYTIRGDRLRFVWPRVNSILVFQFTREQDGTLHLKPILPMDMGDQFIWSSQPWRRIGPPTDTAR
jgi:TRAP-type C4-dicarboxylate transport system substrate-binding protein